LGEKDMQKADFGW